MALDVSTGRSPRYPRISLADAIRHAKRLYDGAHRSVIDTNTAYRVLGYSGKTGASATVLGALRQYGLLSGLRGDVSVSDLALRILEPSSRAEYADAIVESANTPDVFKAISDQFSAKIPNSDEPIRAFLIRSLGFSKAGAEECISSFRESLSEASMQAGSTSHSGELEPVQTALAPGDAAIPLQPMILAKDVFAANEFGNETEFVRVLLSRECTAELRFSGSITREAIDRLLAYIELMKPIWAEE